MKAVLTILAALFALVIPATAQLPSLALNIGPAGYSCGAYNTSTYYCFGIPVTATQPDGTIQYGSLWMDNAAAYYGNKGFVEFFGVSFPNAQIDSISGGGIPTQRVTPEYWTLGVGISGPGYTGSMTLHYHTFYSRGGGGRGCGGCGFKWVIDSGVISTTAQ